MLSGGLLALHFILRLLAPDLQYSPARPFLILFFLAITNFIFYYQLKATTAKGSRFVNIFLVTTGFKLLFFLAIIVIYALIMRNDAVAFITDFFILYLFFTVLEVFQIKHFQNEQVSK
jgi:hypothetical protein